MPWRNMHQRWTTEGTGICFETTFDDDKIAWLDASVNLISSGPETEYDIRERPESRTEHLTRPDIPFTSASYDRETCPPATTAPTDIHPLQNNMSSTSTLLPSANFAALSPASAPVHIWDMESPELECDGNSKSSGCATTGNAIKGTVAKRLQRSKKSSNSKHDKAKLYAEKPDIPETRESPSHRRNHNIIERRYRTRLNQSILDVADRLPSGRKGFSGNTRASPLEQDGSSEEAVGRGKHRGKIDILQEVALYIDFLHMQVNWLEQELATSRAGSQKLVPQIWKSEEARKSEQGLEFISLS